MTMQNARPLNKTIFMNPQSSGDELYFKKFVFIGYTDVTAAGSRALLGIDMRKEYYDLDIPQLRNCHLACTRSGPPDVTEQDFVPFQLLQCKYEQFSLVIINTEVPAEKCHNVANKIIDLCVNSQVEKVILLTTLRLEKIPEHQLKPLYENTFNTEPVTKKPSLPWDTKISDALLSTLIQMIQLEAIPCSCLISPGCRALSGKANTLDGSLQAIQKFQKILSRWAGLKFNEELSFTLVFGSSEVKDVSRMTSLMYV